MSQDHGTAEAARHGIARSPHWHTVEKAHLAKNPLCAACANPYAGAPVQVHHKFPFHYAVALGRPDLELDDRNLITLCETEAGRPGENHHLLLGHLDDFKSSNVEIEHDALKKFHGMTAEDIKADPRWAEKVGNKMTPLDKMSEGEKADFKKLMDTTYPKHD